FCVTRKCDGGHTDQEPCQHVAAALHEQRERLFSPHSCISTRSARNMQPACTLPGLGSELPLPGRFIKGCEPVPAPNHQGSSPGRVLLETDRFRPMSEKPLCFGVPLRNLGVKFRGKRFAAV